MLRRLRLNLQSQANRRRMIRFSQLRSNLCPICNNIVYFDTKENLFRCKTDDCSFKEEKSENIIYQEQVNKQCLI